MLSFKIADVDEYQVAECMVTKFDWKNLAQLQFPQCLHICIANELMYDRNAQRAWLQSLRDSITDVKRHPELYNETAPIYGMCATIPNRSLVGDVLAIAQDEFLSVGARSLLDIPEVDDSKNAQDAES